MEKLAGNRIIFFLALVSQHEDRIKQLEEQAWACQPVDSCQYFHVESHLCTCYGIAPVEYFCRHSQCHFFC